MEKTNTKNWVKIVITIILSAFLVILGAHALEGVGNAKTAYAETVAACPTAPAVPETTVNTCTMSGSTCPTGFTSGSTTATAQTCTRTSSVSAFEYTAQAKNAMWFLMATEEVLNKLLWPVLTMIGGLLDNSLLFGNGMEERLREIWIPIRNIVNILFVLGLVGIALYNVLGIGDEQGAYSVKAMLPKIIVGIIVVNFSFVGIKVFLDAVNILTTSIFSLPNYVSEDTAEVFNSSNPQDKEVIKRFCKLSQGKKVNEPITDEKLIEDSNSALARAIGKKYQDKCSPTGGPNTYERDADAAGFKEWFAEYCPEKKDAISKEFEEELAEKKKARFCNGLELSEQGKAFFDQYQSSNVALAMALNMSNVVFYQDLAPTVDNIEEIFITHVVSIMLYVVFATSFIVLFVVLLARLVFMWLAIALSPLLLLTIAIPEIKEKIGIGEMATEFVHTAIAPISIGICMTVGWIMLHAIRDINMLQEGAFRFDAGSILKISKLNTLQDLVVMLGTVAVVWMGVFAAANKTIAKGITEKIKGAVSHVGKFVGTMPLKHIPLFPVSVSHGEHAGEEFKATGEQLIEGIKSLGDTSNKKYKLSRMLEGEVEMDSPKWASRNARNIDDLYKFTETNRARITTKPYLAGLQEFAKNNTAAMKNIHPENKELFAALNELKGLNLDDEKGLTRAKEIAQQLSKDAEDGKKELGGAKGKPEAGKPTSKTPPVTPDDGTAPLLALNKNDNIKAGKLGDIKKALDQISSKLGDKNPKDAAALKAALEENPKTKGMYDKIENAFADNTDKTNGEDKLNEYLKPAPKAPTPPAQSSLPPAPTK